MLTVGLLQINNTIFGRRYLPYSAGLLQAWVQAHARDPSRYTFLPPQLARRPVDAIVADLVPADVVGFSVYQWNMRLSLEAARRLKLLRPHTLVVFGGPQVPDRSEAFLRAHPWVDVCVSGEGEQAFLGILEAEDRRGIAQVPGASLLLDGAWHQRPRGPRIPDLDEVPSPWLTGVFDGIMAAHPEQVWMACWETNRGCPFSCTFCDWGSATASRITRFGMDRLLAEIQWFADRRVDFLFCCDANFGMLPRDQELAAALADVHRRTGFPREVSVQNAKNATDRTYAVHRLLGQAGLNKEVPLSLQSVDEVTLAAIRRSNISLEHFEELARRFTADGVATYTDVVLGLPGETLASFTAGVGRIIDRGQTGRIKFYNLGLLPNAEMSREEERAKWGIRAVKSRLINIQGPIGEQLEVEEEQELVVGTHAMPEADWTRARAFAWMMELVFFNKLLQMPMHLLHHTTDLAYDALILALLDADRTERPILGEIVDFFFDKARDIQQGGTEHCEASRWPGSWWPADGYALIQLSASGHLGAFVSECVEVLAPLARARGGPSAEDALRAAARLNAVLVPSLRAEAAVG